MMRLPLSLPRLARVIARTGAALALLAGPALAGAPAGDPWERFTQPVFHELTTRQGLPHDTVSAMAQDRDGLVWIGTFGGLVRFDGYRMHRVGEGGGPTLPDLYIRALLPLPDGRMVIGTNAGGLAVHDPATDRVTLVPVGPGGTAHAKIFALAPARDGGVWVATEQGLDRFDPATGRVERVPLTLADGTTPAQGRLFAVMEDKAGNLWVGGKLGMAVRRAGSGRFEKPRAADPLAAGVLAGEAWAFLEDSAGRVWFGTGVNGAGWVEPASGLAHTRPGLAEPGGLANRRTVRTILEVAPGKVWFGTDGAGVLTLDMATGRLDRLANDPSVPTSLNGDGVRTLMWDHTGNIWAGTHRGAERHDAHARTVRSMFASTTGDRGLSAVGVIGATTDRDGRAWLGLVSGRIDVLDFRAGEIRRVVLPEPQAGRDVQALAQLPDGDVLAGSRGVARVDPVSLAVTPSAIACVEDKVILFIGLDGPDILVGSYDGLSRFTPATGACVTDQHRRDDPSSLADNHVRVALRLKDGRLVVGTAGGISVKGPDDTGYRSIRPDPDDPQSLPHGYVTNLVEDDKGRLWVGMSGGGIAVTDVATLSGKPRFRVVDRRNGLPHNNIDNMLADGQGRLWASTPTSLLTLDPETLAVRRLGERDGVTVDSYFIRANGRGPGGELLFGGPGGLSVVDPGALGGSAPAGRLAVTGLTVNQQRRPPATLPKDRGRLELGPAERSLGLELSLLDYRARGDLRYSHRLEGFDETWVELPASLPTATYTNLPSGEYRLVVKAESASTGQVLGTLSLDVAVAPRWHEKPWFQAVLAVLAMALLVLVVQVRTAILRRRQRELEETVAARTHDLLETNQRLAEAKVAAEAAAEAKAAFLASMSHEIRTPLNGVLGFNDLLLDSELSPTQREWAEVVRDAGRSLLMVVNDVLDLSRAEAGQMELDPRPFALAEFANGTARIVAAGAAEKGLRLRVEMADDLPPWVLGDSHRLRQVVLNLLNNAVKFTEAGGVTLSVTGGGDDGLVRLAVTDTGIGIPADRMDRLFQRFSQVDATHARRYGGTGLGLAICKAVVTRMGGSIGVDSVAGVGSTFWVEVPLPPAEAAASQVAAEGPRRTTRLLVAEDVAANRQLALAILTKAGHGVDLAEDGATAVELARTGRYDLVLMDMQMPVMDGIEAARAIRALPGPVGRVPILALTASALPEEVARCRAAGMDGHLAKPFTAALLLDAVARWALHRDGDAPGATPWASLDQVPADQRGELVAAVRQDVTARLRAIRQAGGDPALLRQEAHAIRSAALNFGLSALAQAAAALERGADGPADERAALVGALARAVAETFAEAVAA